MFASLEGGKVSAGPCVRGCYKDEEECEEDPEGTHGGRWVSCGVKIDRTCCIVKKKAENRKNRLRCDAEQF